MPAAVVGPDVQAEVVSVNRATNACSWAQSITLSGAGHTLVLGSSLRASDCKPISMPASSQPPVPLRR